MKRSVTILGDYCFYLFVLCSLSATLLIFFTPARQFLYEQFIRMLDIKGRQRALVEFDRKLEAAGISRELFNPMILIRKRSREMLVLSDDTVVATYPVGLGRATIGIKLNARDQKTPEGQYFVCKKDDQNRFYLFLQINYPAPDDAKRGAVQQIIKPGEEARIEHAWQTNSCPPTDTALGGPLGIHGFGAESSWTNDGSISMHNVHIEELFWNIATGTSVAILP